MVFEQFLESEKIKQHAFFVFLLGMFYVLVGYFVSSYFFESDISVAVLFACTLLLTPSIYTILDLEEKIESKEGIKHFFRNHRDIFKVYLSLFLGIFFAFLLLGNYSNLSVFDYQLGFLQSRGDLVEDAGKINNYAPTLGDALAKMSNNILVVVIAFVLSVFYGAGALFLVVLNASVFAAFLVHTIKSVGNYLLIICFFLIHLIPELSGFLLAAIAGGVVSRAIMSEKFGSKGFSNVMRDALVMLLLSAGLIVIAALLEVFVSARLVQAVI